jgi:hypothetical protein
LGRRGRVRFGLVWPGWVRNGMEWARRPGSGSIPLPGAAERLKWMGSVRSDRAWWGAIRDGMGTEAR